MFGVCGTQTIVYIVLLLVIPIPMNATVSSQMMRKDVRKLTCEVPYKEAASWKRMNPNKSQVDVQRLYDAYRERFREESGDAEENGNEDMDKLTPDEKVEMVITVKNEPKKDTKSIKEKARLPLVRPPRVYEAIDDRQTMEMEKDQEKQNIKSPRVSGMVILKLDVPSQPEIAPLQTIETFGSPTGSKVLHRPAIQQQQEATDRRLADLHRVYQQIMNAHQQSSPASEIRRLNVQEAVPKHSNPSAPGSDFNNNPIPLSPLTELIDVVDRLDQTDLVNDIAKKINDETESQPIQENTHHADFVTDSSEISEKDEDGINKLFDRIDPNRASLVFKRVANEMKAARPRIKSGGLYDEYKKRLYQILKEQKYPRQSTNSNRSAMNGKTNDSPQSRCDAKLKEGIDNVDRNNNYLKALHTYIKMNKENQQNGGVKPYYLPNSKNRQLVWNEVPLVKQNVTNLSTKPVNTDTTKGQKAKVSSVTKTNEAKLSSSSGLKENKKKPSAIVVSQDLYPGVEPKQIGGAVKAIKESSFLSLFDEYQKQMQDLNKALQAKQRWWKIALDKEKPSISGNKAFTHSKRALVQESPSSANTFPGVLLSPSTQQIGGNIMDNLASQMSLTPLELAQRIASAAGSGMGQMAGTRPPAQANVASQINPNQTANAITNFKTRLGENSTEVLPSQQQMQQVPSNLANVLDKILLRLESIKDLKFHQSSSDSTQETNPDKPLPCCFADPADGAPCDLNGSWESQLLGIRINIRGSITKKEEETVKPTCAQPKMRTSGDQSFHRHWRQCVKVNSTQIKSMEANSSPTSFQWLNVTIQEITPPREHDIIDNLTEWNFSGHTLNILGGPISLSCRRADTNLIGTFVGYCRTCGCVDTIFGSWTFCQPSRDCQDITTSIFDRRDMLRRYSMEDRRPNRFKEQLYLRSKFAKMEKNRQRAKQVAFDKVQPLPAPQNQSLNHHQQQIPNPSSQSQSNPYSYM